ncbi:MAG: hypothetical protein WAM79_19965 [Candidatus Sulfotelmatobacter sp.]
MKWQFKDRTPAWAWILAVILILNIALQIATAYGVPRWAPVRADLIDSYPIRYQGGPTYFVQPWLGLYFDYGFEAGFGLLALFIVLLFLNRDNLERVR